MANRSMEAKLLRSKNAGRFERWALNTDPVDAILRKTSSLSDRDLRILQAESDAMKAKRAFVIEAKTRLDTNYSEKKAPDYLPCEVTARVIESGKTMKQVLRSHF